MGEVIIVGAGPAGSATALSLARAGVRVRIIERTRFPRRKACGEYLAPGAVAALRALDVYAPVRAAAFPIERLRVSVRGAPALTLALEREALAIAREQLDDLLLQAACAAGASLQYGRVEDVSFDHLGRANGVVVRAESGDVETIAAPFVVGADGAGSIVARKLRLSRPARRPRKFAVGGHYRGFEGLDSSIEMYVGGGAYFAINPLGADLANVMLVVPQRLLAGWSGALDSGIHGAARSLAVGRRSFEGVERVGARIAIGPLEHRTRRRARAGALLVGDALSFLDPFTGQGVYLALAGAQRAAATVVQALRNPAREGALLRAYVAVQAQDAAARRRLSAIVDLVLANAWLACRVARRIPQRPRAVAAFTDAMTGISAPHAGFSWRVLGQLLL